MNAKYILAAFVVPILTILLLVSFSVSSAAVVPTPQPINHIIYVHDDVHRVGCWLNQSGTAISCIPDPGRCETIRITQTVRAEAIQVEH